MKKQIENISMTYFIKGNIIEIDRAINKIVYIEVYSPLKYGNRIWSFYGRVINVTKSFFEIIQYCDGFLDKWRTDQISIYEKNIKKKKWAKKSIVKLVEVSTKIINEDVEYYNN